MFRKPLFKNSPEREEDDPSSFSSPSPITTPKKSKNKQNPYAMGGRDKFATVLADLDRKRRTIYEQVGTQDITKVRFGYCDSQKWVPIVVRSSRDHRSDDKVKSIPSKENHVTHNTQKVEKEVKQPREDADSKTEKSSFCGSATNLSTYIQPSGNFPIVFVLVLFCLGVYGRVFAVIFTCIWWFLMFRVKNNGVDLKELVKRRDYERLGGKKMASDVVTSTKTKISNVNASPKRGILSWGLNGKIPPPKTNLTPGILPKMSYPNTNPTHGLLPKMSSPENNLPALLPKASPPLSPKRDYLIPPFSPKMDYASPLLSPKRGYFSPVLSPKIDYLSPPLSPDSGFASSPKRVSIMSSPVSPTRTPTPGLSPRHTRVYNKSW